MNAREQMEAFLAGKVIMCEGDRYSLNENGNLMVWIDNYSSGYWDKSDDNFIFDDANYVVDESKCVDFAHALGMMAQGKVMKCLWSDGRFRIFEGALQSFYNDKWTTVEQGELLEDDEMESMWVEVEQ